MVVVGVGVGVAAMPSMGAMSMIVAPVVMSVVMTVCVRVIGAHQFTSGNADAGSATCSSMPASIALIWASAAA